MVSIESTINNNNTKCYDHPNEEIIFLCKGCSFTPACSKCITKGGHHSSHELVEADQDEAKQISKIFKNQTLSKIEELIFNKEELINKLTNKQCEIQSQHSSDIDKISNEYREVYTLLQISEQLQKNELIKTFNENEETIKSLKLKLSSEIGVLSNIVEYNKSNTENSNIIRDVKHNFQYKLVLSEQIETLPNLINSKLIINHDSIDKIKTISKTITSITNENNVISPQVSNGEAGAAAAAAEPPSSSSSSSSSSLSSKPKVPRDETKYAMARLAGGEYIPYRNGDEIPEGTTRVAIVPGNDLPKVFPSSVSRLLLPDGFDQSLDSLPSTIKYLYIFNINLELKQGTIPNTIESLTFCEGFSQKIEKGVIPESCRELNLLNIVKAPSIDAIKPTSTMKTSISKGYKHGNYLWAEKCFDLGRYKFLETY
ncbi:hypothetical protein ACTFIZ_001656 [Dictyostelium cf. discoideum]